MELADLGAIEPSTCSEAEKMLQTKLHNQYRNEINMASRHSEDDKGLEAAAAAAAIVNPQAKRMKERMLSASCYPHMDIISSCKRGKMVMTQL